jgi:putative transposase
MAHPGHDGADLHRAHLIRHSLRYVPRRQYDQVAKDPRPIYTALDADQALHALDAFEAKRASSYQ